MSIASYRPDVDGLRAVAVLPIILYHFGCTTFFGGGYVGVDIFFVISGYLITGILRRDILSKTFSLTNFYERRFRRIVPALLFLLTICLPVGVYTLIASDFTAYIRSYLATLGMVSNFWFWSDYYRWEGGYFDAVAHTKALLHTWSLSVEEQFYLLFPPLLYGVYRLRLKALPTLCILCGLSFAASVWLTFSDPNFAFYLLPTRAAELLLGGILAFVLAEKPALFMQYKKKAGVLGLVCIALAVVGYGHMRQVPFPGIGAILPCLGAVFCIFSGSVAEGQREEAGLAGGATRLLSLKPLVYAGVISYSLYLWHWPINVFYRYFFSINDVSTPMRLPLMLGATVLMAWLSYVLVETPIRRCVLLKKRRALFLFCFGYVAVLAVAGALLMRSGNEFAYRPAVQFVNEGKAAPSLPHLVKDGPAPLSPGFLWAMGDQSKSPSVLLMGDSHGHALGQMVESLTTEYGLSGALLYMRAPILGTYRQYDGLKDKVEKDRAIREYVTTHPSIAVAIIVMRWGWYIQGDTAYEAGAHRLFGPNQLYAYTPDGQHITDSVQALSYGLRQTVEFLQGRGIKVFVAKPIPEQLHVVPVAGARLLQRFSGESIDARLAVPRAFYDAREKEAMGILREVELLGAEMIDPATLLCDEALCYGVKNNKALYYDDDHLNFRGAMSLKELFRPAFESFGGVK